MSKNKNFNKPFNKFKEVIKTPVEENIENVENVENVEITTENVVEDKNLIGIVADCKLLNVRSKPEPDAEVLTIIPEESLVTIIDSHTSLDFYEILIGDLKGFCMKKFIKIKE